MYNHRPLKAAISAAASAALLTAAVVEQRALADARTPGQHEERAARRNTRILLFALSVTFSALDAYVDAHLADFAADEGPLVVAPVSHGSALCLRWRLPSKGAASHAAGNRCSSSFSAPGSRSRSRGNRSSASSYPTR